MESFIISDVDIIVYTMYNRKARKMVLNMKASDFDTDGFYSPGGGEQLCLLGIPLDIPEGVTRSGVEEREEILVKTFSRIGDCISCGERTTEDTIVFGTRYSVCSSSSAVTALSGPLKISSQNIETPLDGRTGSVRSNFRIEEWPPLPDLNCGSVCPKIAGIIDFRGSVHCGLSKTNPRV